ncbi:hypothetical protein KY284_021662 [Solanum tuberosum]|nr:hypothetical protein KY284_021662 [Solanum tuberosum]
MAIAMETEQEEEEMIELGNLSNHIVESIFTKIPLKSLIQLKTVSKTWRNSITNIRHCYPLTTSTGFVLFLKHKTYQESVFMKLHDQTQKNFPKFCTFHSSSTHKFPYLIDSCNGVLLYASENNNSNGFWTYSVSSPVLDQIISLPISHHISRPTCSSLVFESNLFQVISFFWEEVDFDTHMMNCMIFESNSWKWRETQIQILNSQLLQSDGFIRGQCFNSSVFSCEKRKLYWIWSLCLLVYDIDFEVFTLFSLPKNNSIRSRKDVYYSQFLYESSEGGVIQFCDPVNSGVFIWSFRGSEFKFDHFVRLVNINDDQDLRFKTGYSVKPCAFNKDLRVLYLHVLPHTIAAYSFETQELVQIWSYEEDKEEEEVCWVFKIFPFLFSSVDLFAYNKGVGLS